MHTIKRKVYCCIRTTYILYCSVSVRLCNLLEHISWKRSHILKPLYFSGISALKDVAVTVPQAVNVGDTVTLQCRYDLEGEDLYMVKWYRGAREFFRFIPKELPSTQVFALQGIDVDVSKGKPVNIYFCFDQRRT